MVIADTSIWINAQRQPLSADAREFWRLYDGREIAMVGPVLAELLHGMRTRQELDAMVGRFKALDYLEADQQTWTAVGRMRRELRLRGELIGFADCITSALAIQHDCAVYTLDGDYDRVPGLRLHSRTIEED